MKHIQRVLILVVTILGCGPLLADSTLHPVKISKAQAAGKIFEDFEPVIETHDGNTTHDVEVFRTPESDFDTGVWRTGAVHFDITEPYPYHEYMHFIEGSVTLTSSDGTVTELVAGDSVVIPMGWTGTWDTPGCLKIYVIYAPNKDL